jgi:hypothetical protein
MTPPQALVSPRLQIVFPVPALRLIMKWAFKHAVRIRLTMLLADMQDVDRLPIRKRFLECQRLVWIAAKRQNAQKAKILE